MISPKKHKLNIFDVLGKLSKKNSAFYDDLDEDEQKALQPLVLQRWLTGTDDARQIYFINELVNPFVFPLTNHKKLLVQLIATCTSGQTRNYNWVAARTKTGTSKPHTVGVIKEMFGYSTRHAKDAIPLLTNDDIIEYAEHLGRQPDVISAIRKELKGR